MTGPVVKKLRKMGYNARIILEGVDQCTAEEAMKKAGFTWFYEDKLVQYDSFGKIIRMIPLK